MSEQWKKKTESDYRLFSVGAVYHFFVIDETKVNSKDLNIFEILVRQLIVVIDLDDSGSNN